MEVDFGVASGGVGTYGDDEVNDGLALYEACMASPDDDLARLVYADWLEDHGQVEKAAKVRDVDRFRHVVDKTGWGEGPWTTEPDRVEFRHLNFPCVVVRNGEGSGCLNGYVAVPFGHPWYELDYNEIHELDTELRVHGGLTFSASARDWLDHLPTPDDGEEWWWVGFDTAHSGDFCPRMESRRAQSRHRRHPDDHEAYRELEYVVEFVRHLAARAEVAVERELAYGGA